MLSIVTDSTVDLTSELIERYGIHVIPYIVHHGQRTFRDGVDLDSDGIYRLVDETGDCRRRRRRP
jgi:fatty acid-binding protein DegV